MPPSETRSVRLPRLAFVVRILFALFLFGTGIMTMSFATRGYPVGEAPDEVGQFMIALQKTGYLIFWVGFLKTVAGGLMFFPRTTPLAILMALPYAFNILLYVIFFAHQYLVVGLNQSRQYYGQRNRSQLLPHRRPRVKGVTDDG